MEHRHVDWFFCKKYANMTSFAVAKGTEHHADNWSSNPVVAINYTAKQYNTGDLPCTKIVRNLNQVAHQDKKHTIEQNQIRV